jgi:hypothetical protein
MIYILFITSLIITLEIIIDKKIWKHSGNDKPWTTIIRGVLILSMSIALGNTLLSAFLAFAYYFLVFDFALNVARWDELPKAWSYKRHHNIEETRKEKILFAIRKFNTKFFYHGDELKVKSNFNDWYDLAFQRTPPQMELLIKIVVFSVAVYYY